MNPGYLNELKEACAGMARPGKPSRFVRLFKPRFAPLVADGRKTQTIRPLPKRIPRPGDALSLREWSGPPYRSPQRLLLETTLREIKVCHISEHGIAMQPPEGCLLAVIGLKVMARSGEGADRFAREDGFQDWNEMRAWFQAEHGLPFSGVVLYWNHTHHRLRPGLPAAPPPAG